MGKGDRKTRRGKILQRQLRSNKAQKEIEKKDFKKIIILQILGFDHLPFQNH